MAQTKSTPNRSRCGHFRTDQLKYAKITFATAENDAAGVQASARTVNELLQSPLGDMQMCNIAQDF